jgi:hypothetical protein
VFRAKAREEKEGGEKGKEQGQLGYYAERQTWVKCTEGKFWIGYEGLEGLPGPEELERETTYGGIRVALGDGRKWLVPCCEVLPRGVRRTESGEWERTRQAKFEKMYAIGERLFKWAMGEQSLGKYELYELVGSALGWNYHVSVDELSVLGAFSEETIVPAAYAVLDFGQRTEIIQSLERAEKKTGDVDIRDG